MKAKVSDVTGTKALATVYQNATGRPLLVFMSLNCYKAGALENAYASAYVENATPPTLIKNTAGLYGRIGTGIQQGFFTLVFAVPPGEYYKVEKTEGAGSSVSIQKWVEVEL